MISSTTNSPGRRLAAQGPADHFPALTWLSLVELLASRRTPLRSEMFTEELFFGIYGILLSSGAAGRDGRSLLGA